MKSDPDFPTELDAETPAQSLATDFMEAVLANAKEIEEHTLN